MGGTTCFVSLGYITQSLSLVGTSPAKVAFIGENIIGCTATVFIARELYCVLANMSNKCSYPILLSFTVSLGAATVIVCPVLEALLNKKDMSIKNQPQVWLAAILC